MSARPRRSSRAAWPALVVLVSLVPASHRVAAAAGGRGAILLLAHGGGDAGPESALLDALRVYTRDLGCEVVAGRAPPPEPSPMELGRADARGRAAGATMVVWIGRVDGNPVLYALRVAGGPLHRTPLAGRAGGDPALVARTLALKVRALYSRPPAERTAEWTQVNVAVGPPVKTGLDDEAQHVAPAPGPAATAPATVSPAQPPATVPGGRPASSMSSGPAVSAERGRLAPDRRTSTGIEVGAAGAGVLGLPSDPRWVSGGASVRLALLLPDLPIAVELDAWPTVRLGVEVANTRTDTWDVPVGLAATWRWGRGRWVGALGPRISVHAVHASVVRSGRRSESSTAAGAGLGLIAQGRVAIARGWSFALIVGGEVLLPRTEFVDEAQRAERAPLRLADPGQLQLFASLGVVWSSRD